MLAGDLDAGFAGAGATAGADRVCLRVGIGIGVGVGSGCPFRVRVWVPLPLVRFARLEVVVASLLAYSACLARWKGAVSTHKHTRKLESERGKEPTYLERFTFGWMH
jgi:hypothetical protein